MMQIIQINKTELREVMAEMCEDIITEIHAAINRPHAEPEQPTLIYGIKGLAAFLNISVTTAQKLKNDKLFPCYQRGRTIVFKSAEVMHGLESNHKRKK